MRTQPTRYLSVLMAAIFALSAVFVGNHAAFAQTGNSLVPASIPGEVIYVPFPVNIKLDGDLSDWEGIPFEEVTTGTMLSTNPAENGSFRFALAADQKHLYITMSMPDANIITGQHGGDYWNEDSFEFYLNVSGDLSLQSYNEKVAQVRIIPGDIGNTNPAALTLSGMGFEWVEISGYVFKTAEGWGFEAAVSLTGVLEPAHGVEFGFQAQANGASQLDRDVKLIWSKADTDDTSYLNPGLFGRAIFYEVGQTTLPTPQVVPSLQPTPTPPPPTVAPTTTPPPTPAPTQVVLPTPVPTPIPQSSSSDLTWLWVVLATGLLAGSGLAFGLLRRRK